MPNTDLSALPDSVLIDISSFLVGERKKSFSVKNYKTDLVKLFLAIPRLYVRLVSNFEFHRVIRGGVEETIEDRLQDKPKPVEDDVFNARFKIAKKILVLRR